MTIAASPQPSFRDPSQPLDERVTDLLGRMTREEKIAQLGSAWAFQLTRGSSFSEERSRGLLEQGIGQVTRISGATSVGAADAATLANDVQRHLVEHTRLGIPAVVHEEVCSGVMARETTIFPQAIGIASTWEPELNRRLADVVRVQMRAVGAHQGLSPVLDVVRDVRWGRTEETYGEDPHLVAAFGTAFVSGLQGEDPRDGVLATAKHFVGYSASEGGLNWAPAHIPPRELREVYLHPFEAAVREAGLGSMMNAYHELDGIPCGASHELLTEVLRHQWGFEGTVVSDYFAVDQLFTYHDLARDQREAAAMALAAGIDVELPGTDCYARPLLDALDDGLLEEQVLDTAVERVLRQKFQLGLFEDPYVDAASASSRIDTDEQRTLALHTARKSMVLLKNDAAVLPLAPDLGAIAVIGPNADSARNLLGDYTHPAHMETLAESKDRQSTLGGMPTIPDDHEVETATSGIPTVLDELRARFGDRVRHAVGCEVTGTSTHGIEEAVALAADADVAVLVVGDKAGLTDDSTSGEARDRSSLDLPGVQEELVRAVVATGTPVVVVLIVGRPTGSEWLHEHSDAVLLGWLPGQAGAQAIAEVLAGEVVPGGKLPISFPRSAGHVPVYYGHKRSGGRSHWKGDYADAKVSPLYPFGHGLSYTTFEVSDLSLDRAEVAVGDSVRVSATVTNTGDREGDEVLQVYIRDPEASITRPVLELKSFARVALEPGASRTVTFELPTGMLGFYDRDLVYTVEPGRIQVHVGRSAKDLVEVGEFTILGGTAGPVDKVFSAEVVIS